MEHLYHVLLRLDALKGEAVTVRTTEEVTNPLPPQTFPGKAARLADASLTPFLLGFFAVSNRSSGRDHLNHQRVWGQTKRSRDYFFAFGWP